jgi:hypothetical protein
MKFLDLVNKKYQELNEQVPGEPLPGVPPAVDLGAAPAPVPAAPETGETPKPLTAEGEVFLVRLLKKALFMNPGDLDEKSLKDLPEINETNATEALNSIVEIMKKYSNTIDVNTEPK